MKKVLLTCAAAGLLVGSTVASAAAIAPAPMFHPWYVGVGLKWNSTLTNKTDVTVPAFVTPAITSLGYTVNGKLKNKLGWDIFAGYMVTPKFGTELGFVDYGKATYNVTVNIPINPTTILTGEPGRIEANGWLVYFDGMYYVPVCNHFKVFAKGGVDYINHTNKLYINGLSIGGIPIYPDMQPVTNKYQPISGNIGVGAQFDYNQFGARLTYTNYSEFLNSNTNMLIPDLLNLDFMYSFG